MTALIASASAISMKMEVKSKSASSSGMKNKELMGVLLGAKDTGKSANLTTIPKLPTQRHTFLTADSTTMSGIRKFTAKRLLTEDPGLRDPIGAARDWIDKNIDVYELTEFYDPTDLKSAPDAADYVLRVFDKVKRDGAENKVGVCAIEHYDVLFSKLGADLCREAYNLDRDQKIDFRQWDERSRFLDPLDALIETVKCGSLWLVGYGEEDKEIMVAVPGKYKVDPNTGEKKEAVEVKVVKAFPKWIVKRNIVRNSLVRIDLEFSRRTSTLADGTKVFKDQYLGQVITSKHERFDPGMSKDLTNVGLLPFFSDWWVPK